MAKSKKIKPIEPISNELEEFAKELDEVFDTSDPVVTEAQAILKKQDKDKFEKKIKIVGWIATSLSMIGILLNAYQIIWCWAVWIISNFVWIYWSYKKKVWSQVVLWIGFLIANVFGWYVWATILK